jgi:hypothetical protein
MEIIGYQSVHDPAYFDRFYPGTAQRWRGLASSSPELLTRHKNDHIRGF